VSDAVGTTGVAPTREVLLAQAEQAAEQKEWSQAADLLAAAGDATDVVDKRVFYLSRARRYDEALEAVATLRARDPDNFLWPYMTAYQYYAQERYAEAIPEEPFSALRASTEGGGVHRTGQHRLVDRLPESRAHGSTTTSSSVVGASGAKIRPMRCAAVFCGR